METANKDLYQKIIQMIEINSTILIVKFAQPIIDMENSNIFEIKINVSKPP